MAQINKKNVIVLYGSTLGLGIVRSLGLKGIKCILLYNKKDEIARFPEMKSYLMQTFSDNSLS